MAHYDIFRQELAIHLPAHGHALWEPSPGDLDPVEIGDVGFIRQGRFHRLFNCLLPADHWHPSHQDFGVPEYHEPLELNVPQRASVVKRTLDPNNFCSNEVMTLGGQAVFAPGPEPEQISYSCSRQGAILSLPVPAQRRDTLAQGDFGKWMVTHIDLWYAFTRRLGLGITHMEDIVLITGRDLTRSSANIAFLQGRGEARVSFGVHVSHVEGTDVPNPSIGWQFPPEERQRVELNLGPNGQNLPENQCIFIRGFRVTRLLGILPRLRAAAGPSQNPDQDEPELDMQLLNISADSNYQDPLHTLLEYIAMKAPDCDMILVHDNDLMRIDNVETFKSNTVIGRAMPEVWQVQCGETEAETPILKVATLSKNLFGRPANVSQPLALPASDLPSPFGEPGRSSHAPGDDHKQQQLMKPTKPPANIRKYDAATEAQSGDRGTSLHGKLPRKVEHTRSVKSETLPDRGQGMPPESAVAHMERSSVLEDVTAKDKDGLTPLHRALCQGLPRVALTLLEHGADATALDNIGRTPLHWASSEGDLEVIRVLLDRGANTTARDNDGWSPLHLAVEKGHAEVALVLLEHGADATARDNEKKTALHWASSGGHMRATRALLDSGADATARDKNGWTPLHLALSYGHEEVALVLLEHGADVAARDDEGKTILHLASSSGYMRVTRALLVRDADTTAQDKDGRTPLDLALSYGHEDVALVLLEHGADATARDNHDLIPPHRASLPANNRFYLPAVLRTGGFSTLSPYTGRGVVAADATAWDNHDLQAISSHRADLPANNRFSVTTILRRFSTPSPYTGRGVVAERPAAEPAMGPMNHLRDNNYDPSLYPVSADTIHQYNLQSCGRNYARVVVTSHASSAQDTPLLFFGEELKGFVALSLNDLSGMQSMNVVLQMFDTNPMIPSYEAKRLLLPQQVDDSRISGGKFYWPFDIAPPTPSVPPPGLSSCSTVDPSLEHQSSSSGGCSAAGNPTFQLIVTICRRGHLTRNVRVRQQILYISPPDPSVRPSPQAISVDLPHNPPAITSWPRQNLPAVIVEGVIFDQDYVQVECNLISPSSYPISDIIPLHLTLTSQNREALDLFGVSQAIDVRLQKVLAFGERASAIHPLSLTNRNDYHRADFAGKAHWELDGHARQLPSNDEYSRPRWCMELNGKLRREAHVELTPSFEEPGVALMYFVSLFPFRSPDFHPARDPNRELVMGKIQLTRQR